MSSKLLKEPKRILIIGSSMSMPRIEVQYKRTWIYKIIRNFPDIIFIDKSRRGSTTDRLINEGSGFKDSNKGADILEYYSPNIVITQIGITDCAPRYLKKKGIFARVLSVSPNPFKKWIFFLIKKIKKRSVKNADVSIKDFISNWTNYIERSKIICAEIICINISPPTSLVNKKSPEIKEAINIYNQALSELEKEYTNFHIVQVFNSNEIDNYAIDEFHVNELGHDVIFQKVKLKMLNLLKSN